MALIELLPFGMYVSPSSSQDSPAAFLNATNATYWAGMEGPIKLLAELSDTAPRTKLPRVLLC